MQYFPSFQHNSPDLVSECLDGLIHGRGPDKTSYLQYGATERIFDGVKGLVELTPSLLSPSG